MNVTVSLNLPPGVEEQLRATTPDLSAAVREAYTIDLFRKGVLTHYELGQALGLDRFETDALLKRHQVTEHSLTHEDVEADVRSINEHLGPPR